MYKKGFRVASGSGISRKGQVTVFIILGILLLLALTLVILLQSEVITISPDEIIPTQKGKVENSITLCMEEIGDQALQRMGVQAGFVNVPREVVEDGNLHLRVSPMNVVPYWAYGVNTNIPSLQDLKLRIDQYVEDNLRECVLGLEAFQETYTLVEKSELTANTEIVDSKVIFNVDWDLEIRDKANEVVATLTGHVAESPIKLKRVHETAKQLVEAEMRSLKLEDITQDLIALEHPDVPVAGVDISCKRREWNVNKAKETLRELLRINIRELKLQGTNYVEFPEELTYYQNHYVWNIGELNQPEVGVTFNYNPTYPTAIAVTPVQGTKMRSSQLGGNNLLSLLCIQTWKFTYDVTFPVLVQVRDETTGYVFNTAFTVHVVRNIPNRQSEPVARESYLVSAATDEDYCRTRNIPMTVFTYELVENEQTGVYSREPLGNVNTSLTCLRYRCDVGTTEYDFARRGDVAGLDTFFPYCVGGILRGEKGNYKEDWQRVVTEEGKEVELELVPLFNLPQSRIKFLKHDLKSDGSVTQGRTLNTEDIASLKISYDRKNVLLLPGQTHYHESSVAISPRLGVAGIEQELQFLAKTDFTYSVDINLVENDQLAGGYKGNWTVFWEELRDADEVVFHIVRKPVRSEADLFEFILGLDAYSKEVPSPEIR